MTNPTTSQPMIPSSLGGLGITSLLQDGTTNTSALNIEMDIPTTVYSAPKGEGFLRIWGLGIKDISQSFNLNGANIEIRAGMKKGLPLANPQQSGLIVKAQVFQAFGNWVGTAQTVDLIVRLISGTNEAPVNYVVDWHAGQPLADALKQTLDAALPGISQTIAISPSLIQNHDEPHFCGTLEGLADFVMKRSKAIITDPNYRGVEIAFDGTKVSVTDTTSPPPPKAIQPQDLIGQPTWIGPATVQIKTVMRADIKTTDIVSLPNTLVTTTAQSLSQFRSNSTFSGKFFVTTVHHFGNFRQPDAASWNTTFDLVILPQGS